VNKSQLEKLFDQAASNLAGSKITSSLALGKPFELFALTVLLRRMLAYGYKITAIPPHGRPANRLVFGGGPCNADKSRYTHFQLDNGTEQCEAWVSVEVRTLSLQMKGGGVGLSGFHEFDIGIFRPLPSYPYKPQHDELVLGASCKHRGFAKEFLREALGLRRESALLRDPMPSLAPWFIGSVPAEPAAPIILFSSDSKCIHYAAPADLMGVYVRRLVFP